MGMTTTAQRPPGRCENHMDPITRIRCWQAIIPPLRVELPGAAEGRDGGGPGDYTAELWGGFPWRQAQRASLKYLDFNQ